MKRVLANNGIVNLVFCHTSRPLICLILTLTNRHLPSTSPLSSNSPPPLLHPSHQSTSSPLPQPNSPPPPGLHSPLWFSPPLRLSSPESYNPQVWTTTTTTTQPSAEISSWRNAPVSYNHWQNCWNDGWFRGAPLPHFNVVRWRGKTWPTLEQNFAAVILNVKSTLNGGKGGCWIFFFNLNEKQGVVRCAFQLLLSLIVPCG